MICLSKHLNERLSTLDLLDDVSAHIPFYQKWHPQIKKGQQSWSGAYNPTISLTNQQEIAKSLIGLLHLLLFVYLTLVE